MPEVEEAVGTQSLFTKEIIVYKYVDDNVICEKLNLGRVEKTDKWGIIVKEKQAIVSQNAFRSIVRNAIAKGMKVNNDKTCILCISDNMTYTPSAFIETEEGERIDSCDSLKVLGFHFESKPTVRKHVETVIKKFRQRYWFLRHLRKLGFNEHELVRVYKINVLPIADYTDVVYHSLMTDDLDEALENAQNGALKCIFDPRLSARALREKSGLSTLRNRRVDHIDKFARKCAASQRFGHLFPKRDRVRNTRTHEEYIEEFARCERLRNSPLFFMRRRLNGKVGMTYGERNREFREA